MGCLTTGAGNDIERATEMAGHMVTEWGMSRSGPLASARWSRRCSWEGRSPSAWTTAN